MSAHHQKPTALRLLAGNPGKQPINHLEPIPDGDLTSAPTWMNAAQREGWDYALKNAPAGLVKLLDRAMFTAFVVAEALHREATEKVQQFGLLTKSSVKGELQQNPYLPIINRQAEIMISTARELGFTPAARSRVSTGQGQRTR